MPRRQQRPADLACLVLEHDSRAVERDPLVHGDLAVEEAAVFDDALQQGGAAAKHGPLRNVDECLALRGGSHALHPIDERANRPRRLCPHGRRGTHGVAVRPPRGCHEGLGPREEAVPSEAVELQRLFGQEPHLLRRGLRAPEDAHVLHNGRQLHLRRLAAVERQVGQRAARQLGDGRGGAAPLYVKVRLALDLDVVGRKVEARRRQLLHQRVAPPPQRRHGAVAKRLAGEQL